MNSDLGIPASNLETSDHWRVVLVREWPAQADRSVSAAIRYLEDARHPKGGQVQVLELQFTEDPAKAMTEASS